jgi:CO/xanthine dehydrogenase Mo-binding subunit
MRGAQCWVWLLLYWRVPPRRFSCSKVILVPEEDSFVNPAGVKGIGELANVGTAAAVANAVYHATGVCVRKLPIRLEKLLTA